MISLRKFFNGPSTQKLEARGDALCLAGSWGSAIQEYERAHGKLEKTSPPAPQELERLASKIAGAKETLARKHQQSARDLIEGEFWGDARELIALAMEISSDKTLIDELQQQLEEISALEAQAVAREAMDSEETPEPLFQQPQVDLPPEPTEAQSEEYFLALCGTLPADVQRVYLNYGENFRLGYCALNSGDFPTAAEQLALAMAVNPARDSYIPLELATAYLHLNRTIEARQLLDLFLGDHPEALPAYQLYCDLLWQHNDFDQVETLLERVPPDYADSLAVIRLKGENLYRCGAFEKAKSFYLEFLETYGWDESIAVDLATIYEALAESENARQLYHRVISNCSTCHTRVDPRIKHRYAELSFTAGLHGTDILELYLNLAQELPQNSSLYFDRVSQIYETNGNQSEAARFRAFAVRAGEKIVSSQTSSTE